MPSDRENVGTGRGAFALLPADRVQARFVTLREAAMLFGFRSPDAIRQAFRRGTLPERYCIRIGKARRVDVAGLTEHLRREAAKQETENPATRTDA